MRLIDADEMRIKGEYLQDVMGMAMIRAEDFVRILNEQPTMESEIIRCKDCVHYSSHKDDYMCGINVLAYIHENDFCSRAERKTHKEVEE